ncbi:sulfite exporter TauE/SafE family protein [Litoribrevibacter albus]|uniref:Probable membrane transporter protein n=1 Tax=Litoribrevibacter albus TaxID=1473156 RepID=A0AA37S8E3_9GAMM|nr:sulfite exporter TauE/SafE family protein [Litoribrevibacter albus]GLQ31117.1 UPF0721 transmembrane protein [Litoribrevibacter albus]
MALIVGLIIGLVLGLTGAGGSVFAVPLLIILLDLPMQQAIGISLGAVAVSALFGTITRLKSGNILWLPALVYSVLGAATAPIGNVVNQSIDEVTLLISFALLVVMIAARMWIQAQRTPEDTKAIRAQWSADKSEQEALCRAAGNQPFSIGFSCILAMSGGAVLTGLLSGLYGVGGGFLIVPTLIFLIQVSIQQAIATSLVVISVISSSGFITYLLSGATVESKTLALVCFGGVSGMVVGLLTSKRVNGPTLQKSFAGAMLIMMCITLMVKLFLRA